MFKHTARNLPVTGNRYTFEIISSNNTIYSDNLDAPVTIPAGSVIWKQNIFYSKYDNNNSYKLGFASQRVTYR